MNIRQKERICFFTHAITILSLFTYSVCDEKVKRVGHLNIHGTVIFFGNLLITFQHYYHAKYIFLTSLIWLIFFISFIPPSTEILTALNF